MAEAQRIVKFVGGPCDGLECRDDSADHFETSIAIVWSLFRIGCGGPLSLPEALRKREARRAKKTEVAVGLDGGTDDVAAWPYRVIRRSRLGHALVSVAYYAPSSGSWP